jgi:ABC-2 type transport system permease protein
MNAKVLGAIFKRNFVSYFSNPTGYVFMCLFVALSSAAAFWPEEFFKANLANLNQLNDYFAFIMLVFIPAITMSVWAEERQQGTDELLLTMPANDSDVVIGKYLATLAIYTVSLLFSFVSNTIILNWLGDPDFGLLACNYAGYFFVGMAMLAVGMIGSFLTSNLTLAFVAGFLLNAPLVLIGGTRGLFGIDLDSSLATFSIPYHLDDFGRGVMSLSAVTYFLAIVVLGLYFSMVLIERRHWAGGRDEASKFGHLVLRTAALIAIAWSCISITTHHDIVRWDWTSDRLNSISPDTIRLVDNLDIDDRQELDDKIAKIDENLKKVEGTEDEAAAKKRRELERERRKLDRELKHLDRQVKIEAFIAPKVPERYVQQRLRVLARLNELKQLNPKKLDVVVRNTKLFSDWAEKAKNNYDITAQRRQTTQFDSEQFFMGAAITAGRDKVIIPFFEIGTSPEYEIVRAICTVGRPQRRKLGVVTTDAAMMGDVSLQAIMSGGSRPRPIISELREQYEIIEVDPNQPIVDPKDPKSLEKFDALLVVQPSSMPQPAMNHVIAAIQAGVPAAIYEDPFAVWLDGVPNTDAERRPRQGMMGRSQPPPAKGDFDKFLKALGIRMAKIVPNRLPERLRQLQKGKDYEDPPKMFADLDKNNDGSLTAREFMNDETITKETAPYDYQAFSRMDRDNDGMVTRGEFDESLETAVIWENFNPYPKLKRIPFISNSWVFANSNAPGGDKLKTIGKDVTIDRVFSKDPITNGMNEVLFLYPGAVLPLKNSKLNFEPLVATGDRTGAIRPGDVTDPARRAARDREGQAEFERRSGERYVLAARLTGKSAEDQQADIDVVFVADVDPLSNAFLDMREQQVMDLDLMFQNVAFVLNTIDSLAGDSRFLNLRKNEVKFRKLTTVEQRKEESRKRTDDEEDKYRKEFRTKIQDLERQRDEIQVEIDETEKLFQSATDIAERKKLLNRRTALKMSFDDVQKKFGYDRVQEQRKRDEAIEQMQAKLNVELKNLEERYKWFAVLLPPIPPLLVAIGVFFSRRAREKEGVSKKRLR